MHWLVLAYMRDQLADGMVLTPMPEPLFMRVLQPVAAVLPQPKRQPAKRAPRSTPPSGSANEHVAAQASDGPKSVDSVDSATESAPLDSAVVPPPDLGLEPVPEPVPEPADPPTEPTNNAAEAWPADTRLSYSVKGYYRGDFYGSGQVQWQHKDGRYQVQVDGRMALFFTGTLISQGELSVNGLRPHIYEERALGRVRHLSFDGAEVSFHDGKKLPKPDGVQDTASQFVELTQRFSSGRQALAVGAEVAVWLARPRQMNLWVYDVVALETLQIAEFGAVAAFHLKPRQVANPSGTITADLWFAPSLQYLPVRIRINAGNDNFADLIVNRIEQGTATVNDPR